MAEGDRRYLGSHVTEEGTNFAIWAPSASKVELAFFDWKDGVLVETRNELVDRNGPIFHGYFKGIRAGQLYGYRIHGEWDPINGWRFNPNKVLIDPYAHILSGELIYSSEIYSHRASDEFGHGDTAILDDRDNSKFVPLSVVSNNVHNDGIRLLTHWSQTIIYEAHVRGLTQFNLQIPENERGTYKALAHPSVIKYLKDLGVTALELMPIQHFITEPAVHGRGRENYWGYNPIAFSAPHREYAATDDPVRELRDAVSTLHENGIEVILDVVYNHTGEGGIGGPTLSFRGIDSRGFYRRITGSVYDDVTGCGNTLDASNPFVVRLITDSLRWWCEAIGVDGFRFDLAAALARRRGEIDGISPLVVAIATDPVLRERKLIAEPWDTQGYALGAFPYPWREWNDKYRDILRQFWLIKGGRAEVGEFATRISGSHDVFYYRGPTSSINFITSHDGFTLRDLTSYNEKHNEANLENNRDGNSTNFSWNCGVEGQSTNPTVVNLRITLQKSLLGSLLMSAGIPMILMGDEVGRSQFGSNNSYSLPLDKNNELKGEDAFNGGWALKWSRDEIEQDLYETTKTLIQIRKDYLAPVARTFFTGEADLNSKHKDLAWFTLSGQEMTANDWSKKELRTLAMYVDATLDQDLLMLFNAEADPNQFTLPDAKWGNAFRTVFDSGTSVINYEPKLAKPGEKVVVPGHSIQIWFAIHD